MFSDFKKREYLLLVLSVASLCFGIYSFVWGEGFGESQPLLVIKEKEEAPKALEKNVLEQEPKELVPFTYKERPRAQSNQGEHREESYSGHQRTEKEVRSSGSKKGYPIQVQIESDSSFPKSYTLSASSESYNSGSQSGSSSKTTLHVERAGIWDVSVQAEGYYQAEPASVTVLPNKEAKAQVKLSVGAVVKGQLWDENNQGVFEADIKISSLEQKSQTEIHAKTNRSGKFTFPSLSPGAYRIEATLADNYNREKPYYQVSKEIELEAGQRSQLDLRFGVAFARVQFSFTGPDGQAVLPENINVYEFAEGSPGSSWSYSGAYEDASAPSSWEGMPHEVKRILEDFEKNGEEGSQKSWVNCVYYPLEGKKGSLEIIGLIPGKSYYFEFSGKGLALLGQELSIHGGVNKHHLTFPKPAFVTGKVENIEAFETSLELQLMAADSKGLATSTYIREDGSFFIGPITPGLFTVRIPHPENSYGFLVQGQSSRAWARSLREDGKAPLYKQELLLQAGENNYDIMLTPPPSLEVQVFDDAGIPLEGATIYDGRHTSYTSDAEGKALFRNLEPGRYQISATFSGSERELLSSQDEVEVVAGQKNSLKIYLQKPNCVRVTRVISGSQAGKLGLQKDDLILNYNWSALTSFEDLRQKVIETENMESTQKIPLTILRDGQRLEFELAPGRIGIHGRSALY